MIAKENLDLIGNWFYAIDNSWRVTEHEEKAKPAIEAALTFTTKDEYLAWVAEWKKQYAELSQESRRMKVARKASRPETYRPDARNKVIQLKYDARAMLHIRQCGKGKSWQLKQKAKHEM